MHELIGFEQSMDRSGVHNFNRTIMHFTPPDKFVHRIVTQGHPTAMALLTLHRALAFSSSYVSNLGATS